MSNSKFSTSVVDFDVLMSTAELALAAEGLCGDAYFETNDHGPSDHVVTE